MNLRFLAGRKSAIVIALCVVSLRCHSRESSPVRTAEPRFSGHDDWRPCARVLLPEHVVENAECGTANLPKDLVSLTVNECDDAMTTAADAVLLIGSVPQCTDAAVEKLETLARSGADAHLLSDLAGAYYVRAQQDDRPSDFVRSLDAADRAFEKAPALPAVRFNRALAQEELGFSADAIDSWDALRNENSPLWAKEAARHYEKLMAKRSHAEAVRWTLNKQLLPVAAGAGDRKGVRQLVTPYCTAARHYVEDELLPAWAKAFPRTRATDGPELHLAEMIASAFAQVTGDRYLVDVVDRIRSTNDPQRLARLAAAHQAFSVGRGLELGMTEPSAAAFERAEHALSDGGSPLRFGAMLGRVTALTKAGHYDDAFALLRAVERSATESRYTDLLARVHAGRGYLMMTRGHDIDALAEYSVAQAAFVGANDMENVGSVQNIIVGLLRRIGDENLTWRAALVAQRYLPNLVEAQYRHTYLGENALSAVELGYPAVGLHYQNLAVRMLQDELSHAVGSAAVENLRHNLGIAVRTRAGIYAILKNDAAAQVDLAASTSLLGKIRDGSVYVPVGFRARLAETDAQKLANTDRPKAIERLSEAIRLASATYYQTLTASLHLQRAELYRLDGNARAATTDLERAIAILRGEEKAALDHKTAQPSQVERLWSAYFSRSQEAYRRLIRQRVESGADADAFKYAEKARAYEPLHLVLQRNDLPAEFRNRIHDGEPLRLDDVKEIVPAGAFLLEYSVLDDRTYVWIVGRGYSDHRMLPVGESAIKQWTHELQRFAGMRNDSKFHAALAAPYKELFAEPLKAIPRNARLIIVPDRAMHGLPFSALRDGERYLIQDHAVSVQASATLFAFSLARDEQLSRIDDERSVLLLADPAFNTHLDVALKLARLDAARAEVRRIQTVYAGAADVKPPLMDGDATVSAFLRLAAGNAIVHLAAHGVANPEVPSRSFFLLAPAGDDSGVIDAEHLVKELQLTKTRLAILSACSSAGGTPVGAEGLAPLVRPFVAAGVPGVVGTLWNVSDSLATEDLLVRFHQHYRDGRDAARALQLAQQEMIAHPSKAHSAAWAWSAFQMYGCASSPFRLRPITKEEIK